MIRLLFVFQANNQEETFGMFQEAAAMDKYNQSYSSRPSWSWPKATKKDFNGKEGECFDSQPTQSRGTNSRLILLLDSIAGFLSQYSLD